MCVCVCVCVRVCGRLHEGEVLVDVEQGAVGEVFGGVDGRRVGQHLSLQLGEGHQRLHTATQAAPTNVFVCFFLP